MPGLIPEENDKEIEEDKNPEIIISMIDNSSKNLNEIN
jgi:hypothetical protein